MKKRMLVLTLALCIGASNVCAQEPLHVKKVTAAPGIDGTADAVWDSAPSTLVKVRPIPAAVMAVNKEKDHGKYAKNWAKPLSAQDGEVELKAVYTDDEVFFLARWKDDTKDDQHKPWKWEGDKETGEYLAGKEREDRLAFMFPLQGEFPAAMLSGHEATVDMWQWKAARTNAAGVIHDKTHSYSKTEPKGKFASHYTAEGDVIYVARPGDGGESPYKSNKVDPFTHQGETVAQYIPVVPGAADAADVKAKGLWQDGSWTVEIGRKLNTGHAESDTVFDPAKGSATSIAVFNHAGDHFHATSGKIDIVFD